MRKLKLCNGEEFDCYYIEVKGIKNDKYDIYYNGEYHNSIVQEDEFICKLDEAVRKMIRTYCGLIPQYNDFAFTLDI